MTWLLEIRLLSDLCAGNGESNGSRVDTDCVCDAWGLPVIPARRLKGCLREAAELLGRAAPAEYPQSRIDAIFGTSGVREGSLSIRDAELEGASALHAAIRRECAAGSVVGRLCGIAEMKELYTTTRSQTAMQNGVALDGSLRTTRVVKRDAPGTSAQQVFVAALTGEEADEALLKDFCAALRHIGTHRNRGLGNVRCNLKKAAQAAPVALPQIPQADRVRLAYTVQLEAAVVVGDAGEISASTVIGCLATAWLKEHLADETFRHLFTDGTARWSALTPVIEGETSYPTPLCFVCEKNKLDEAGHPTYISRYHPAFDPQEKIKTLEGTYLSQNENGACLAVPGEHTVYHNNMRNGELYMQKSLDAGQLYGGSVDLPGALAAQAAKLLADAPLRFGRSRSAQYAACRLLSLQAAPHPAETTQISGVFYVVLQAPLLLVKDGIYRVDDEAVRGALADKLGVSAELPRGENDWCCYGRAGGFQATWRLQKPQHPLVGGGSVYAFEAKQPVMLPRELVLGAFAQEGYGLCRIYARAEMQAMAAVKKTTVDAPLSDAAQEQEVWRHTAAALLQRKAAECANAAARIFYEAQAAKVQALTASFIGRLDLMRRESNGDYADFIARVESVKNDAKRKSALALLHGLLGEGKRPAPNCILGENPELMAAITDLCGTAGAEYVESLWTKSVETMLVLTKYAHRDEKKVAEDA